MKLIFENWRTYLAESLNEEKKKKKGDPCWKGYEMVGMKEKDGREVPNCVPLDEDMVDPSADSFLDHVEKWEHSNAAEYAKHLAEEYGDPDEFSENQLTWRNISQFDETTVRDESIPHDCLFLPMLVKAS
jgi:hypothetical protein